jgi:TadE-like protein
MNRMKRWARLVCDTAGAEIAEAAFVLPLVFMLIFGIMWFGRALNIYSTLNRAAEAGAQAAATSSCATCTGTPPDVQTTVVNPILLAAHLDPNQAIFTMITPPAPGSLLSAGPPAVYGSQVNLSYPYNFKLNGITCCPFTLSPITTGITITATAQARQEQ